MSGRLGTAPTELLSIRTEERRSPLSEAGARFGSGVRARVRARASAEFRLERKGALCRDRTETWFRVTKGIWVAAGTFPACAERGTGCACSAVTSRRAQPGGDVFDQDHQVQFVGW